MRIIYAICKTLVFWKTILTTTESYSKTHSSFVKSVAGQRPVTIGCVSLKSCRKTHTLSGRSEAVWKPLQDLVSWHVFVLPCARYKYAAGSGAWEVCKYRSLNLYFGVSSISIAWFIITRHYSISIATNLSWPSPTKTHLKKRGMQLMNN